MEKVIGIDLGTNSIGWALRNLLEIENQIIDKGVLIFDKGVGEVKGIETPLVKPRTDARGKRRNYQAEKYRKWELLEFLIEKKMCPLTTKELDEWRKYKKGVGRKYPQSEKFIQWLRFDFNGDSKPDFKLFGFDKHESYYLFRMLVVSEDKHHKEIFESNSHILGRVLYQIVQRRGYRGRDDEDEEAKTILKGSEKNGTIGVEDIIPYIEKYKTLGAALYYLQKEKKERIRKRYNLRTDYEQELKEICRVQNFDENCYKRLWKAIIWQRPLRSQKGLVGICTFEKNKARCPVSHPLYEEYRTWVFINNLKIELPENTDKVKYLKDNIYPIFYKASDDFKLSSVAKVLDKVGGKITARFPHGIKDEKGKYKKDGPDTKVVSAKLLNSFQEIFGENWKVLKIETNNTKQVRKKDGRVSEHQITYTFEDFWHVLFSFDSKDKLKEFAKEKLNLNEDQSERFCKIRLQQGYATLSLSAIKKLLPYLTQGFIYSEAVYLANLHKVLGAKELTDGIIEEFSIEVRKIIDEQKNEKQLISVVNNLISEQLSNENRFGMKPDYKLDADDKKTIEGKLQDMYGSTTWKELTEDERASDIDFVGDHYESFLQKPITAKKDGLFLKIPRLHDRIFTYLKDKYTLPDKNIKYLWHPSEQETYLPAKEKDGIKQLGDPQPISRGFKNPMALKTLHKLKQLMNYLLKTGKIDETTRVVVEIARELNDANRRKAIEKWQRDREKQNDEYKKKISEIAIECDLNLDINNKEIVEKYRLWIEQNHTCLYTGQIIDVCDLFNGTRFDFEHSIPASMSFDNELKNLTIADSRYNREVKKKMIPFKCPNYNSEYVYEGITYSAIKPRLKFIEEKVNHLENLLDEWRTKSKFASTKDIKDACIQRKHLISFELEYWRKKLDTFTCKEYKAGWRNSQLRDTQIVTKYALPYLKTAFNKVDVQKGSVTAAFREIYKIQPRLEKKDRSKHSHHAIDAAVLTLIPPSANRDKILLRYNEEKDKNSNNTYHEKPSQWSSFESRHILSIEDDVLINFQAQHRTLTDTYKKVRKRGKQQFVKEKHQDGKWQYKLDEKGDKIPLVAQGDTIRGALHNDSFFGLVKQPEYKVEDNKFIPLTDGIGNFIFQKNEKRDDDLFVVKKELLSDAAKFSKIEDLEKIIDPNLKSFLGKKIGKRISNGKTFIEAISEPIWAFDKSEDKNGNLIRPIRHIRCKVKGGGGGYVTNPAHIREKQAYLSSKSYKNSDYALNGETYLCALYQVAFEDRKVRETRIFSILDIAKTIGLNGKENSVDEKLIVKKGKKQIEIPLYAKLLIGQKVIFYKDSIDDLKTISKDSLNKLVYYIIKFEDGKISFKHNLTALSEDTIKSEMKKRELPETGASFIDFERPILKLRLARDNFNFAIEGKHFEVKPDGKIEWSF